MNNFGILVTVLTVVVVWAAVACGKTAEARGKPCAVRAVRVTSDERNSTYVFNLDYDDLTCTQKDGSNVRLQSCDDISDQYKESIEAAGKTRICPSEGNWKIRACDNGDFNSCKESVCFKCLGRDVKLDGYLNLNTKGLKLDLNDVHPLLKSWNVAIYKATSKDTALVCDRSTMMSQLKDMFRKIRVESINISRSVIQVKKDLDVEYCYCIVMEPISDFRLWPQIFMITRPTCKPKRYSDREEGEEIDDLSMSDTTKTLLLVLAGMLVLVAVFLAVVYKMPHLLTKSLDLKALKAWKNTSLREQVVSSTSDVLLLHAPDLSCSEHLAKLKKQLEGTFKVHDLFDYKDLARLSNPSIWMQNMLLANSDVKLIVVESAGLINHINSLINYSTEHSLPERTTQAPPGTKGLLTFALWTIICTNLRNDYSSVFVVRFSDEVKDPAELLVKARRYGFPEHFSELVKAISASNAAPI